MMFMAAPLLAALVLAAVPIIIHILNRRRFQTIEWPPMRYLKLTLKRNRRRIRIEQMLLLALRTLAVAVLILAVARPVLSSGTLAKLLPGRARTGRIIVLDDSLSMGYSTGGHTAFESGRNAVADIIRALGAQDSLTVLTTSEANRPLVKNARPEDAEKLAGLVSTAQLTDAANSWGSTLTAVKQQLAAAPFAQREVVLVTDLRRAGWTEDVTTLANDLAAQRVQVRVVVVGTPKTDDVALLRLDVEGTVLLPGAPIQLAAQVRNNTPTTLAGAQATLAVDGAARPVLLPDVAPGATVEVPLTVTLENAGTHVVTLSLPHDALPADDVRSVVLEVRPTVNVLMVDGAVSPQPFESETDFLALAFGVGNPPWNVQRVSELDPRVLRNQALAPDVLVLANVNALSAIQAEALERRVESGMGLMVFPGDLMDAEAYNLRLFVGGHGVLPAGVGGIAETPTAGLVVAKDAESPLAALAKLMPEALSRVRARRYLAIGSGPLPEGTSVLARWNNAENPPAVLERRVGKGRVMLFTTTAGRKWSDWPLDPTYLLAMRAAALGVARGQDAGSVFTAGDVMRVPLEEQAAVNPTISGPDAGPGTAPGEALEVAKTADGTELRYAHAVHAGLYTLTWGDAQSRPVTRRVAANPARSEMDLEPLGDGQLAALLGNLEPAIQRYDVSGASLTEPPHEIWRTLALTVLAMLCMETVFAVWVGRER